MFTRGTVCEGVYSVIQIQTKKKWTDLLMLEYHIADSQLIRVYLFINFTDQYFIFWFFILANVCFCVIVLWCMRIGVCERVRVRTSYLSLWKRGGSSEVQPAPVSFTSSLRPVLTQLQRLTTGSGSFCSGCLRVLWVKTQRGGEIEGMITKQRCVGGVWALISRFCFLRPGGVFFFFLLFFFFPQLKVALKLISP